MTGKFFGFFRLLDACAKSGCPACRLVEDDGRRYLDALVYEQVNDPDTRRCIRAAWGFCNWHTWTCSPSMTRIVRPFDTACLAAAPARRVIDPALVLGE